MQEPTKVTGEDPSRPSRDETKVKDDAGVAGSGVIPSKHPGLNRMADQMAGRASRREGNDDNIIVNSDGHGGDVE